MSGRDRWLAARRERITASDVAAILGEDPYRNALSVYAEKVGAVDVEPTDPMLWGLALEDGIGRRYAEVTGRPVVALAPYEMAQHPDIPWLSCTPDRWTEGTPECQAPEAGRGPLQIKAQGIGRAQLWREQPPTTYLIQVQIEMACTGAAWASLAAFLGMGEPLAWTDIVRDDAFLGTAIPQLEAFLLRVQRRDPPDATDGSSATFRALRSLYPLDNGETVDLTDEQARLVEAMESARAEEKRQREIADVNEARIRAEIAAATFGALPDGSYLELRTVERKGYTATVKPTTYRSLKHKQPKIRGGRNR